MNVTEMMHHQLNQKRGERQELHRERLEYHGLAPKAEHFSIDSSGDAEMPPAEAADLRKPFQAQYAVAGRYDPPARSFVQQRMVAAEEAPAQKQLAYQRGVAVSQDPEKKKLMYQRGVAVSEGGEDVPIQPNDGTMDLPYPQSQPSAAPMSNPTQAQPEQMIPANGVMDLPYPEDIADDEEMPSRFAPKRPGDKKDGTQKKVRSSPAQLAPSQPAPVAKAPPPQPLATVAQASEVLVPLDGIMELPYPSSSSSHQAPSSSHQALAPKAPPPPPPTPLAVAGEDVLVPVDGILELQYPRRLKGLR